MLNIRVLLVDNDQEFIEQIRTQLPQLDDGIEITIRPNFEETIDTLKETKFDVIVSDYLFNESTFNAIDCFKLLRKEGISIPFIIFTAHDNSDVVIEAVNTGINHYHLKSDNPFEQFKTVIGIIKELASVNISKLIHHLSHDIGNILHNIYGFAQLLEDEFDPTYIERIQKLIMKCKDVVETYVEVVDSGVFAIPEFPKKNQ